MEKIGEIVLTEKINIMDAFDVIEQFTKIEVENIAPGLYVAYNEEIETEWGGQQVTQFLLVNKQYFENHPDYKNYNWQTENNQYIDIEKGIIGIFNESFKFSENYLDEMTNEPYDENAELKNYVVCSTPLGEDGCYSFDTVKLNEKIVAIKVNFPDEEH